MYNYSVYFGIFLIYSNGNTAKVVNDCSVNVISVTLVSSAVI